LRHIEFSPIKAGLHCLGVFLFFVCMFAGAEPLKLAVVLSENGGAYQEYSDALGVLLAGKNVTVNVTGVESPLPASDLVITVGMKASLSVARTKAAAMLAVLVPKDGFNLLFDDFSAQAKSSTSTISAIYLDQPYKRQLDLIAAVLPRTRSIGVLYSTPPKEINKLRMLAESRKMVLNERVSASSSNLYSNLQSVMSSSEVLLALPDNEIYNASTIRNILLATYRNKLPLIGFSSAYVKAGALCAVFSTPQQIARQSINVIQEFAVTGRLSAAQAPKEYDVAINEQVARSLGLNIRSATQLHNEIGALP